MEEYGKHGKVGLAGVRAGMSRKTAAKYLALGELPSALARPRRWRTRVDPFGEVWPEMVRRLEVAPELEAKTLFEDLLERAPGQFSAGQLRTLQRRVKRWRAQEGPEKRVFFSQCHRPGEAAQTDFTHASEFGITIEGEVFPHMLCHFVLPYSNWEWATVCHSESMEALQQGVQAAAFRMGRVPEWHQTDHSTAATHKLSKSEKRSGDAQTRGFNDDYLALMRHLGMKPRTTQVGEKEQNGDVEALNGAFKRRAHQHLLLRGSRDFASVQMYEAWLQKILEKVNGSRSSRYAEELSAMRELRVDRLPDHKEFDVRVTSWSTIRVRRNTYSVPSRLVGERVRVRVFGERIEVYHSGVHQLTCERLRGEGGSRINYRHIIWSLVRKPGAFERYRYREDLFPSLTFRKSYDALRECLPGRKADVQYLRILHLAAKTLESQVGSALDALLDRCEVPLAEHVKALVGPEECVVPELTMPVIDLGRYDELLSVDASRLAEVAS